MLPNALMRTSAAKNLLHLIPTPFKLFKPFKLFDLFGAFAPLRALCSDLHIWTADDLWWTGRDLFATPSPHAPGLAPGGGCRSGRCGHAAARPTHLPRSEVPVQPITTFGF